jgi:uncharacterized protein (TIGR02145 family)
MKKSPLFIIFFFCFLYTGVSFSQTWLDYGLGTGSLLADKATSVTTWDDGYYVIVTGVFQDSVDFEGYSYNYLKTNGIADIFVANYANMEGYLYNWAFNIGGTNWDEGKDIVTDTLGNIYITGFIDGSVDFDPGAGTDLKSSTGRDCFLAKYDISGNYIWSFLIGSTDSDEGSALDVNPDNEILLAGTFFQTVDFDPGGGTINLTSNGDADVFFAKYDTTGTLIWAKNIGGIGLDEISDIEQNSDGYIFITGTFTDQADFDPGTGEFLLSGTGPKNIFIAKYDSDGNFVWAKSFSGDQENYGLDLATDRMNNVYVTGSFNGIVDFDPDAGIYNLNGQAYDIYLTKLGPEGDLLWVNQIGGLLADYGKAIDIREDGTVVLTGFYSDSVDFDPGPSVTTMYAMGTQSPFVATYDAFGFLMDVFGLSGSESTDPNEIVSFATDLIVFTGEYSGDLNLDPQPNGNQIYSNGETDILLCIYYLPSVNTAPIGKDKIINIPVNTVYHFDTLDFGYYDVNGDPFQYIYFVSTEGSGEFFMDYNDNDTVDDGENLMLAYDLYISDIQYVKFKPWQDETGVNYASLRYIVSDYVDHSHTENVITFNVNELVTDYDGNIYPVITIGTASWMAENLRSTHYADGTLIDSVFAYDDNEGNVPAYGRLYTWNAAMRNSQIEMTQGVCPTGWHLPARTEWQALKDSFTRDEIITDGSSGLEVVYAGRRSAAGSYQDIDLGAAFWTSTLGSSPYSYLADFPASLTTVNITSGNIDDAYSVRCVKNYSTDARLFPNPDWPFEKVDCQLTNSEIINIGIINGGQDTIQDFDVSYTIDGGPEVIETITQQVKPGDTLLYDFTNAANLYTTEYLHNFSIVFHIIVPGDQNPGNDSYTISLDVHGDYTDQPGWTSFNLCNGLNENNIWSILQDHEGDLWFGGFYGVNQYDGTSFNLYYDTLGLSYAWASLKDSKGNLWFGSQSDSGVTRYDGLKWKTWTLESGQPECIYEDSNGMIWFGMYGDGLYRFDGQNWTHWTSADGMSDDFVLSIGELPDGNIVLSTFSGVNEFDGEIFTEFLIDGLPGLTITEIFNDSKENTWFTSGSDFYAYDGSTWTKYTTTDSIILNDCQDIDEDNQGNLWFGGTGGVMMFDGTNWTSFTSADGLVNDQVFSVFADMQDNIWFGTFKGGLSKKHTTGPVITFTKTDVTVSGGADGAIDLTVTGGTPPYTITWNNGAFTEDLNFLKAGKYTVEVKDADNRTSRQVIRITEPAQTVCDIQSDFSFTVTGNTVTFDNLTDIYQYQWDFGDGSISGLTSPNHVFTLPGLYTVCLTTFDTISDCSIEKCKDIQVGTPDCIAGFSYYIDNTVAGKVYFTNESEGAVTSWFWNFGDGNFSTAKDPEHTFKKTGTWPVCLYTLDTLTGCQSEICENITIGVTEMNADFSYFIDQTNLKVTFTDLSTGNITDRYWTFGDGTFYNGQDTTHIYDEAGIYDICLTVRNNVTGNINQRCKTLAVGTVTCNLDAGFSYFIDPLKKQVSFTDKSTGNVYSRFWNFGDGTTSSAKNPKHTYNKASYYFVSLGVQDSLKTCNDYVGELIQVGTAECRAEFSYTVDPETYTAYFKDLSLGAIKDYYWVFGDGNVSTDPEPTHNYAVPGFYEVSLTVTDSLGECMDNYISKIQVGQINCSADFTVFIDSSQNTAYFTSKAIGKNNKYYWIFGDGTISTEKNPVHQFTAPGYYLNNLNVFNEVAGCMDHSEKIILISSQGIDCQADFIYRAEETNFKVQFSDRSLGKNLTYLWNFGDLSFSTEQNPEHTYANGGYYNVCLTVYADNDIQNTKCKYVFAGTETTNTCFADFNYTVDNAEKKVFLTDKSTGSPDTWSWRFGDNDSSTLKDPVHQYTNPGYYTVRDRIYNSSTGCTSDAYRIINIDSTGKLVVGFGYEIDSINLKADSYPVDFIGVSLGEGNKLKWSFGDGTYDSTTTTPTHEYTAPGAYEVCYTITDQVTGAEDTHCEILYVGISGIHKLPPPSGIVLMSYPNPFNKTCHILYTLPEKGRIELSLYDLAGRKITELESLFREPGQYEIEFDGSYLESGLYYLLLRTQNGSITHVMNVIR